MIDKDTLLENVLDLNFNRERKPPRIVGGMYCVLAHVKKMSPHHPNVVGRRGITAFLSDNSHNIETTGMKFLHHAGEGATAS